MDLQLQGFELDVLLQLRLFSAFIIWAWKMLLYFVTRTVFELVKETITILLSAWQSNFCRYHST